MKSILFWISCALLLPQALYVRRTAPRSAAAGGPSNDQIGEGDPLRLLGIGDSIIAGVGAMTLDKALVGQVASSMAASTQQRVVWQALGVSGYTSTQVLELLVPQLPRTGFDYIIVSVGVNDITGLSSLSRWKHNLSKLMDALRAQSPNACIAVAGMPPMHKFPLLPQPMRAVIGMRARMFDRALREVIAGRCNSVFVSLDFEAGPGKFSADGYHPSEESYQEFGAHMASALLLCRGDAGPGAPGKSDTGFAGGDVNPPRY